MDSPAAVVVFVDDEQAVLDGIRRMLAGSPHRWEAAFARSVDEGLSLAEQLDAALIVTDMTMQYKTGMDLLSTARTHPRLRFVPVVVLTGNAEADLKRRALENGALDLINKPISRENLLARVNSALRLSLTERHLRQMTEELERRVKERTAHLEQAKREVIWRLARAGELRDNDTGDHVARVADCSELIARELGFSEDDAAKLGLAATLHDVGKVGVSDSILRKKGKLTADERTAMRKHCRLGHGLLTAPTPSRSTACPANDIVDLAARIALHHHERWDGNGYPDGLCADAIPVEARIVAFADALDALCQDRPYKDPVPFEIAFQRLIQDSGSHFDPDVVTAAQRVRAKLKQKMATDSRGAGSQYPTGSRAAGTGRGVRW